MFGELIVKSIFLANAQVASKDRSKHVSHLVKVGVIDFVLSVLVVDKNGGEALFFSIVCLLDQRMLFIMSFF